jgi:4-amino-4-deoxy-L-arabinose transferase-like glycosyltransferase
LSNSSKIKYSLGKKRKSITSLILLLILLSITVLIAYYKIKIEISVGPPWDTFDFLSDALYLTGQGFGHTDFLRPPLLPFLTALFFRLGYVSEVVVFVLDGLFFVLGVLGFYLLLKQRFDSYQSFIGALIFTSFPVVLLWVGAGYTDIASTSLSIWALFLTVIAVRRNPKFFYLSFIVGLLAFLTRFNAAIIIFPMFLYILINKPWIKDYEDIIGGILLSSLLMIPVFVFFLKTLGNPVLPFLQFYSGAVSSGSSQVFAYNPQPFYYVINALYCLINMDFLNSRYLWVQISFIIAEILILYAFIMGMILYLHKIVHSLEKRSKIGLNPLKQQKTTKIKILAVLFLMLMLVVSLNWGNYLFSDAIFFVLSYVLYINLKNENLPNLDLDFLFLCWLISFLIFSSLYQVKVCRYFIPMAPAVAYFMILGLREFSTKIKSKVNNIPLNFILGALLISALLISTGSYLNQLQHDHVANGSNFHLIPTNHGFNFEIKGKPYSGELYLETYNTQDLKTLTNWLKNYDPDYKNKIIFSDYFWPQLSWQLKTDVKGLKNNKKENLNSDLQKQKADYYISMASHVELDNYVEISEFETSFADIVVYRKK